MVAPIRMHWLLIVVVLVSANVRCSAQTTTTLTSSNYNKKKDITSYTVVPYGSANLPGEWFETSYNSKSRQQFFVNKDSLRVSVAFGPANKFEFYRKGLDGYELARAYYNWESKYEEEAAKVKSVVLQEDSVNNFVAWKFYNEKFTVYYLFAGVDCRCKGGAFEELTLRNKNITDEAGLKMLRDIYLREE